MEDNIKQRLVSIFDNLGFDAERIFRRQLTYDGHLLRYLVQAIIIDDGTITHDDQQFVLNIILEDHEKGHTVTINEDSQKTAKLVYKRAYNFMTKVQQQRFFRVASDIGYLGRLRKVITHDKSAFPSKIIDEFTYWYSSKIPEQKIINNDEDDEIVGKQLWFNHSDFVPLARKSNNKIFFTALGVESYDDQESEKIAKTQRQTRRTNGIRADKVIFGDLNAIANSDAKFEYKRCHLFSELLNLQKPLEKMKPKLEREVQEAAKIGLGLRGEAKNNPIAQHSYASMAWNKILSDKEMLETFFGHLKEYNLIAPFYFWINSNSTYAPKDTKNVFMQWCQDHEINLRQNLTDFELIDLSKLEPDTVFGRSLAGDLVDYGISLGSKSRNASLGKLSAEDLQSIPISERDHTWLAHYVGNIPGYIGGTDVTNAINALVNKTASSDDTKKNISQIFAQRPELFTPSVPALWIEYETNKDQIINTAFLLEQIGGNRQGLKLTQFFLHIEFGVLPNKDSPILSSITESLDGKLTTTIYKNNIPFQPQTKADVAFAQTTASMLHFVAALNNKSQPFKLTSFPEDSEYIDYRPLGTIELTGSAITLDMEQLIPDAPLMLDYSENEPNEIELIPEDNSLEIALTEDGIQVPQIFNSIAVIPDADIKAKPFASLSEDEKTVILLKYDEAYRRTKEILLADTQMYLMRALSRECNEFNCFIDLNKPGFSIHLRFVGDVDLEGEKRKRTEFHVLDNYDSIYKELGIHLTMENAVDFKIAVQSLVLNTQGITTTRNFTAGGNTKITRDTQMPLPILEHSIVKDSSGMCALVYKAKDPYTNEIIKPRIPLGLAMRYENETAENIELDERKNFILDYLRKIESHRTNEGYRVHVYKQDVLTKLQSWLEANNKEWETTERIALPGFEKGTLVHVFANTNQKITLAPLSLAMDVGGENPSWHCNLPFYVGDKNEKSMGELVRTRSISLRTQNQQLAISRTLESLCGVKGKFNGLLPTLQEHTRETGHEWRVEKKDKGDKVFIGDTELQDFFDDMMRYERDIGIKVENRKQAANGNIVITLQAIRCLIGDHRGHIQPTAEYMYERQSNTRALITFSLMVPRDKADSINAFVDDVQASISWHAEEAYSSVAIGNDGQTDQRKRPLEYRTSQIRNGLIRAVESTCQDHFGYKLPKDWHRAEAQSSILSSSLQTKLNTP